MLCKKCEIEMVLKAVGPEGPVFVCVNPKCEDADKETITGSKNEKTVDKG